MKMKTRGRKSEIRDQGSDGRGCPPGFKGLRTLGHNRNEAGITTFMFIILLAIMVLLATAESMALSHLHRDVKLLEKQQMKRLGMPQPNSAATQVTETKSAP